MTSDKGHMNQERQGLQSSKVSTVFQPIIQDITTRVDKLKAKVTTSSNLEDVISTDIYNDAFPVSDSPNICKNKVYCTVCSLAPKNTAYSDLTGRFPYKSSRSNQYILVAYSYDVNGILAKPINNRSAVSITAAWKHMHRRLHIARVKPEVWILDNKASKLLKSAMNVNNTTYQLVPPHIHQANLAERAIQTFRNHLKAVLASLHPDYPLSE